jgi:3-oxoadipate enol-lactonase
MYPTVFTDLELKQIDSPVLLLIGAGEKIYRPEKAIARAQRLMPDLTAEIVPDAGHTLIWEQPDLINRHILKFLGRD